MDSIAELKQQHLDLQDRCERILQIVDSGPLKSRAGVVLELMTALSLDLDEHLRLEDDYLYPAMMRRSQPLIRRTAERFAQELGGLRQRCTEFMTRWSDQETIRREVEQFRTETSAMANALRVRMQREDEELFPLLDDFHVTVGEVSVWIEDSRIVCLQAAPSNGKPVQFSADQAKELARQLHALGKKLAIWESRLDDDLGSDPDQSA
ncbi:MAG: hemerythrin domain-containing protein [bacterium]